jgi:hypothetical protein
MHMASSSPHQQAREGGTALPFLPPLMAFLGEMEGREWSLYHGVLESCGGAPGLLGTRFLAMLSGTAEEDCTTSVVHGHW